MQLSLVHFKKEWSGACQIISPVYEEVSKQYQSHAGFFSIDVEKEKGADTEFGIMDFPTILFFRNGEIVDHVVGLISRNMLINKIENALAGSIQKNQ